MDHFSSKNAKIRGKHISSLFGKMMKHQLLGMSAWPSHYRSLGNPVITQPSCLDCNTQVHRQYHTNLSTNMFCVLCLSQQIDFGSA